jgi:hypothetical protein
LKFDFISYSNKCFLSWLDRFTYLECGQEKPADSLVCESRSRGPPFAKGRRVAAVKDRGATRRWISCASKRTRTIRAGRSGCRGYAGEAGGARLAVAAAKTASGWK